MTLSRPLDNADDCIHFNNGCFHLPLFAFHERLDPQLDLPEDYVGPAPGPCISKYIAYDFDKEVTPAEYRQYEAELNVFLSRIIPHPCALHYIRYLLGSLLSGQCSSKNRDFIWLSGNGGNGKTTITKILRSCLTDVYCKVLASTTFNTDREAEIALSELPKCVRFLMVNEPTAGPMAFSIVKTMSEGVVSCRALYKIIRYLVHY